MLRYSNSLIQRNVCLKQLFDNYQLAGNRKATSFVTVPGLSMNKANLNFIVKKTYSFAKCNDVFPLHAFYLNARPQRGLGDYFEDFLFMCFKKEV